MSFIHISRENFFHNISQIALKTQSVDKIALVLKDNAYGHGLTVMADLAKEAGVRHAVVRTMAEAEAIARGFETVLVLADIPAGKPDGNIRIVVNDLQAIGKIPKGTQVELKVDTGMHRNGVLPEEVMEAIEKIEARGLLLRGVMSHHRSADEMGSEFFWQKKRFDTVRASVEKAGIGPLRWHSCNSAALFRTGRFDEDIARVGIAAYGCLKMPEPFGVPPLRPVMSLWAERVSTRRLAGGTRVGYGGEGEIPEGGTVSTYDIGYGDGWYRGDASSPYRLPDGRKIVGRVSMDLLSVEGEDKKIRLFGDANEAAEQFGTIGYDILVKLHPSIPRIVV
jgi:alanine racemase